MLCMKCYAKLYISVRCIELNISTITSLCTQYLFCIVTSKNRRKNFQVNWAFLAVNKTMPMADAI